MNEREQNLEALLQTGKTVILTPKGHSMEPLLHPGNAQVMVGPLKENPSKGDILLWHRKTGTYVLHRMIGENEKQYLLRGDHGTKTDHAKKGRVIGVVTEINRGPKWFPVTDPIYRVYVHIWMLFFPLRACFYRLHGKMRKK